MTLLALECSSEDRSVALAHGGGILVTPMARGGRETPLLGMIEQLLRQAAVARESVHGLAVGLGPGSYTGIRSALALAQGWGLATGARVRGEDSTAACAQRAWSQGARGLLAILVDAQRGEFYSSTWRLSETEVSPHDPLRLIDRREVDRLAEAGFALFGPAAGRQGVPGHHLTPDASSLAGLALRGWSAGEPASLEPVYLRPVTFTKAPPGRTDLASLPGAGPGSAGGEASAERTTS